jgi:NAD(P)-dependent dehydrogenase (short-subunit alcohol dehydrogenase family)
MNIVDSVGRFVFANAGISGRTPTGSTDEAIFENVIHINLSSAFFTMNSAVPLLNDNASIILLDRCITTSANLASPHMQPPRVVSSRWRVPSPPTLHRATFA